MMRRSLFAKIRLAFAITSLFIAGVFALAYWIDHHQKEMELDHRLMTAMRTIHRFEHTPADLQAHLADLHLRIVTPAATPIPLCEIGCTIRPVGPSVVRTYPIGERIFHVVIHPRGEVTFEDFERKSDHAWMFVIAFAGVLGSIVLLYRSITASLAPLAHLTRRIRLLGDEPGAAAEPLIVPDDEIGALARALDESEHKLRTMNEARRLMLRNVAHELKTPLTKGRFLVQMVHDDILQERLEGLFIRFDGIIDELLQIEKLTAHGLIDRYRPYQLDDILFHAVDLLFLDDESRLDTDIAGFTVWGDFKLLELALKNLLDNALKFSDGASVWVRCKESVLTIANPGAPLPRPFDLLKEAFVKGDEAGRGLGLGLYIVAKIADLHGIVFSYRRDGGDNIFALDFRPILTPPGESAA